ncbi:MAG: anaerobic ribonucleoside-triphosphate reductase activating protein [Lachnospiraceae bacterium]|nr:anaerobic ribonucleoside-triphosphate reductase activating protein [Lachnospiraceae bacterium]
MLKYVDTLVSFQEIPDEISLCINISNCPNNCPGCHSAYLKDDIGTPLTYTELMRILKDIRGITCVCFMGGDKEPWEIQRLAQFVKEKGLKVAWYSGKQELHEDVRLANFDYVKLGPYVEELGPLTSPTTNQVMYKIDHLADKPFVVDITSRFWKK